MSGPDRGRILIINNKNFDGTSLEERVGSELDVKNISNVFKRLSFRYDKIHSDLTKSVSSSFIL